LVFQYAANTHQGDRVVIGYHYAQGHGRGVLSDSGWLHTGITGEG
jgi:hypothetical protein